MLQIWIKQTCLERFGTTSSLAAESVKEKIKQTLLEKTGYATAHESPEAIQKTKDTCREKYGATSYFASAEGKEKIKQTFLEKYGVENPSQVEEIQRSKARKYLYKDENFDSSWELALWIYAKDHNEEIEREPCQFEYTVDETIHKYYPDFRYCGKLIEIKGAHLYNADGKVRLGFEKNEKLDKQMLAKMKCAFDNHVEVWGQFKVQPYLKYIKEKYGSKYLQQFRRVNKQ